MPILVNFVDLRHHGYIELVANLLGSEIVTVEVGRFDTLLELRQTHVLLATGERRLANVTLVKGFQRSHGCL